MKTYNWQAFNQKIESTQGENTNQTIHKLLQFIEDEFQVNAFIVSKKGQRFGSTATENRVWPTVLDELTCQEAAIKGYSCYPLNDFGNLYFINHHVETHSDAFMQAYCNTIGLVLMKQMYQEQLTEKQQRRPSISHNREALFRYMLRHMNLGIVEFDIHRVIQYANRSFSKLSGYALSELIGHNMDEFPFANWEQVSDYQSDPTDVFIGKTFEIVFTDRNGSKCYWLISGSQIFNEEKDLTGTIGIVLDITAQKQLQIELSKQKEIAERASLAKERFLATLSHEIRNPLNIIIGLLNQVLNAENKDQLRAYLKSAHQSADYLLALLNNILDYTSIDEEGIVGQESKFIPQDIINEVADYFSLMAGNKDISLNVINQEEQRQFTHGDASKLKQILYGLIGNAIKYTRKGEVAVKSTLTGSASDTLILCVEISDSGGGINEATLLKFKNMENVDKQDFLFGDGMGLHLINRLVLFLKGQMQVESSLGVGTTVKITIPLKRDHAAQLNFTALDNSPRKKPHRILIVEDQIENQKLADIILRRNHFVCEFASNGLLALKALETMSFDLILMDIQMPEMDGVTASKFIRSNISNDIPIIAVTANAFNKDVQHYLDSGMDDVLVKPYTESDLVNRINALLAKRKISSRKFDKWSVYKPYNIKALEEICNGDQAFLRDMLQLFLEITPVSIEELRHSIEQQQFNEAARIAHRMKQSIGNMGLHQTREKAIEIERICKSTHPELNRLNTLLSTVERDLKSCMKWVKKDFQL
ncbi:MAG: response regulator [Flavobacteriales bacterium]